MMKSKMYFEALESSSTIQNQIDQNEKVIDEVCMLLNQKNPYSVVSIARGSSDHAAQYLNFLITHQLGKLTTSFSMSALTLYNSSIDISKSLAIAISQSGRSPDIIYPIEYFQKNNRPSIAIVNDQTSPLSEKAMFTIPILAGKENAVAATKSFIGSLGASAMLVAYWSQNQNLIKSIHHLPDDLNKAAKLNWDSIVDKLKDADRIMVVGRGYGLSLALEASLKLKETCGIQAEAFSAAEIKHGPMALVEKNYPILIFATRGPALLSLIELAMDLKNKGANVILAAPAFVKEKDVEIQSTHSEELDIITAILSFYLMLDSLAKSLGKNPDNPINLSKVTLTK